MYFLYLTSECFVICIISYYNYHYFSKCHIDNGIEAKRLYEVEIYRENGGIIRKLDRRRIKTTTFLLKNANNLHQVL